MEYVLLSQIEDLFTLLYLVSYKKINKNVKIFCTNPVKQIGYCIINEFYKLVKQRNSHILESELCKTTELENNFFDYFEAKYDIDINS